MRVAVAETKSHGMIMNSWVERGIRLSSTALEIFPTATLPDVEVSARLRVWLYVCLFRFLARFGRSLTLSPFPHRAVTWTYNLHGCRTNRWISPLAPYAVLSALRDGFANC